MSQIHGGDIYRNQVDVDFSVNVNPLGMPKAVGQSLQEAVKNCGKYPDITAEELKQAASRMQNVPPSYLLFGNGSSELLLAAAHALMPKKTVIPIPSFYGYEYAAKAAEGEIIYYQTKAEDNYAVTEELCQVLTEDIDLLFLANPNNPTGLLVDADTLKKIIARCQDKEIYVVLDECFVEFCNGMHSMISNAKAYGNLILIRAFTKIFAIPGVRLGYLICSNERILRKIGSHLSEWNVSCFAHAAGCACALESDYINQTVCFLTAEREFLAEGLKRRGFAVFPSDANFLLCYTEEPFYGRLIEWGILIRDCSNFRGLGKGFYRIAIRSRKENEKLLCALEEIKTCKT